MERTIMHVVNGYRRFAKDERLVTITGKNYQTFMRKFTGDILDPIHRIEMQEINPLMQTIAGRLDVAEKAIDKGLVKDIQAWVSILDGQPLSRLYDTELSENDLIQSENERMATGQVVKAISVDKHPLHIMKHKSLLNDPMIRLNSPMVQQIEQHILEHLELQKMTDPLLMAMANTGMVPEMMPPGGGGIPPPPEQMQGAMPPQEMPLPVSGENQSLMGQQVAERAEPAPDLLGRV